MVLEINRLITKIAVQDKENEELQEEYYNEMKKMNNSKCSQQSDLQELKETLKNHLQKVSDLQKENEYLHEENEGFIQNFKELQKDVQFNLYTSA
uniref:Uncharacterized protein n=1 Tax=Sphaerodactylus townsendi TaxID=933632 RepID=A0ACB8FDK2_9SAUR